MKQVHYLWKIYLLEASENASFRKLLKVKTSKKKKKFVQEKNNKF